MDFITSCTWANSLDIDPVESTQKHTSMNPNAGICKSFDFDLLRCATFPAWLARLPVLPIGATLFPTATTAGTVAATGGGMDVIGLDLADDALDLFLSLLIFVTRVAVPFFTFLLFLSPFLINLYFGTSIFLGTSFLLIALLVLVKDVLDVLFFELVPTFSLLRILVALLTYYKPY